LKDLVQDGMIGLIDAACRYDEARGIKFETFAERRVRGAMIDALRKDAWPRGVRRQRRELEAAREQLRKELGSEPSMADLAARMGSDEVRLSRTIVRINTIESTSPLSSGENVDGAQLPAALVPSEPVAPDKAFEQAEVRDRIRAAIASLPARERKVVGLYYYGEATMKEIGAEIGVNESRVSQLHARAIGRLKKALGGADASEEIVIPVIEFQKTMRRLRMAKVESDGERGVLLKYPTPAPEQSERPFPMRVQRRAVAVARSRIAMISEADRRRSRSRNGFASQRHPDSSRKRSASVPATSPVTKRMRRASGAFCFSSSR